MPREAQVRAEPLNVVIVGGSFAGLMCGIALRELGHRVRILEKDEDERQSHMAGVCLGLDAKQFLSRYDRHTASFTHTTTRIQVLKNDKTQMFFEVRRDITSWDTFYFRLRSCFDGYISSHNLSPPIKCENMELCSYESRKELLDIERVGGEDFGLELTILNRETNVTEAIRADLVIGADGPSSFIRAKYSPGTERQYVGYVAWRGTVPENELSTATRETCNSSATVVRFHRHHCIMYMIPGANGSLKQGERLMNFLWYTNESAESLTEIMMDGVTGHVHHNIVPAGHVRKDVWAERLQRAKVDLSGPFLEVVLKIKRPFIQVITEFCSSKAVFEEGRVLLVGDSVSLIRPHTAFSATQAAFHSLMVEKYIRGVISLETWETTVLTYSFLHYLQGIWWGKFYQSHLLIALLSGLYFWIHCISNKLWSWFSGTEPLLRSQVVQHDPRWDNVE